MTLTRRRSRTRAIPTAGAGSFTVALTATNQYGNNTNTKNNYITAGNAPVANFSGTPTTGGAPLAVSFTDSSTTSPTAWSWTFGDSNTSTAQNPSHTYSTAGVYTVALTASNAYGNNTNTKSNYITVTSGGAQVTCYVTSDAVTQAGWGTVVSGALSDMNSDDSAYRVYQSDTADPLPDKGRCDFYHYFATGYTPSQVSKIHVDYKLKTNIAGGGPSPDGVAININTTDGTNYVGGTNLIGSYSARPTAPLTRGSTPGKRLASRST